MGGKKKALFVISSAFILLLAACGRGAPGLTSEREVGVDGKSYRVVTAARLESMLDSKDFLMVNVHIPYAGEIPGTDLFIPYNDIERNLEKLPDKSAKIVVYCRSGMMSDIAAKTLTRLGYNGITDVEGGMVAWEEAGFRLVQSPQ
ncbi:MAG: rhodanese-like domain-containing protein [Chloroflexi bacterium]|nr:rhodanese-like domain-containing protein [Chloroflexota bacterium]